MTTSTEIAVVEKGAVATAPTDGSAVSVFASEGNFSSAQRMAKALMAADLAPKAYRDSLPNTLIAMELASRLRMPVLMVMQNLDVIHGRPSWRATFMIAAVNATGRFSSLRYRWQGEPGAPNWGCRAVARDRETGEECEGPLVTMQTAKAEGWDSKAGSKWKTIPELMLMYRAGSWWARVFAPEVAMGLMTSDEAEDVYVGSVAPSSAAAELGAALRSLESTREIVGEEIVEVEIVGGAS